MDWLRLIYHAYLFEGSIQDVGDKQMLLPLSIAQQVQLQSLKVLSALVSEHLPLILPSLPLIQRVITVCSEAVQEPVLSSPLPPLSCHLTHLPSNHRDHHLKRIGDVVEGVDASLTSPDPGK